MILRPFIYLLALIFIAGCFSPINSTYESARTLEKGQFEFQGSFSKYYGNNFQDTVENLNDNLGFGVGYGISDKFDLKFRYEYFDTKTRVQFFDQEYNFESYNYLELGGKFQLQEDKMALLIPIGVYYYEYEPGLTGSLVNMEPRFIITLSGNNNFETNIIPKATILYGGDGAAVIPGINLGFGISSNLDRWAIRPEFGYNILTFTVGVGFNYRFDFKTDKE